MITFSCDAYENISYFSDVAKSLLSLMGHSGTVPGAFKAEEIPAALSSLQRGLGQDKNKINPSSQADEDENEPQIGLAKRAIPLINMLQAAIKKDCDVMWS
ncbi:DUF1840 domain-containing protein [Legionella maioricensis]|uniref:DUF1840 domain-containing protein n=1 Tax=Legionella maioricensis TaxID=2896528 RepID=A0A9X2CZ50_9GAMM|nr:DUF1840 domain-containing protein [Legionella maioricensis]MCL9683401.1 DUF1840 domain-containing protein [Legionella maioricensis]MCL9685903.1 DUF1840 domain-containing protein [Legionella maioricensis]